MKIFTGLSFLLAALIASAAPAHAASDADALSTQITQRAADIASLEKEIAGYQGQIDALGAQASTLAGAIKSLDLTKKKLQANISLTQDKIAAKAAQIDALDGRISDASSSIAADRRIVRQALKGAAEQGSRSPVEVFFSEGSFSSAWAELDRIAALDKGVADRIVALKDAKADLESSRAAVKAAKADLVALNAQLAGQRDAVSAASAEKNRLLADTKQSEGQYQKILAQKKAQKDAFERDLAAYESQLHLLTSSSVIPHPGSGILSWPLDSIRITQYFGNTSFAAANPQVYNGKGHTGVDFAASIGTPVKAALTGQVIGVGNTDALPTCYSYGKWIMIKHPNGLSSLYAHLSVQSVSIGDQVSTGAIIGYSGNTGYTTGPHLHFGLYASEGVRIAAFENSKNCKGVILPLADYRAYLNPLSYF